MADLYLVRHAQGSFGTAVYDQLSSTGERQSALLGRWMGRCGVVPDAIAAGTLSRQIRTAEICLEALGAGPARGDWLQLEALNEFESDELLAALHPRYAEHGRLQAEMAASGDPRRTFQAVYAAAVARWVSGAHDAEYELPWPSYRDSVIGAFRRLTGLGARSVWAFTSGGPITAVVQHLLAIPDSHAFEINWALVNTGVTRVRFAARDGRASLSSLNASPHLDQEEDGSLTTYR